jgi:hypothetical protein
MGYLLHCLPGAMRDKEAAFAYARPLLKAGGVIFGMTILGGAPGTPRRTQRLLDFYNRKGVFSNHDDTLDQLVANLAAHFQRQHVEVIGSVALFAAYA